MSGQNASNEVGSAELGLAGTSATLSSRERNLNFVLLLQPDGGARSEAPSDEAKFLGGRLIRRRVSRQSSVTDHMIVTNLGGGIRGLDGTWYPEFLRGQVPGNKTRFPSQRNQAHISVVNQKYLGCRAVALPGKNSCLFFTNN
ncbi:hypothetical protein B0H11DRAFT_1920645 [Mycena galericulata]|nr:hypothetical protein B0H11DRAFT_1920645 [Mycena galericulata]